MNIVELKSQMLELQGKNEFVKPHYIEVLGCDGVTAEEIAKSLGTRVNDVRRKLREGGSGSLKSLETLGVASTTLKNINGLEFEEFFLSTAAAKFFVARYENEIGFAYLEYLVRLDMLVEAKCRQYEKELAVVTEKLQETKEAYDKFRDEPVTEEEYDIIVRLANKNLRRQGRFREAYKHGFYKEIIQKFYMPGEDPGTYSYLPRKNFEAAVKHARNRKFDMMTMREFK